MYSVQILTKYLSFSLKKRRNEGISASKCPQVKVKSGMLIYLKKRKKKNIAKDTAIFFSINKCPKINKQENVPSHNHYT